MISSVSHCRIYTPQANINGYVSQILRFEVHVPVTVMISVFWFLAPCNLVDCCSGCSEDGNKME